MSTVHVLKTIQPYLNDVRAGKKLFELRYNDRLYKAGDLLCLIEWTGERFTHVLALQKVLYVTAISDALRPGWVAMSIGDASFEERKRCVRAMKKKGVFGGGRKR